MIEELERQVRALRRDLQALFWLCVVLGVLLVIVAWFK